MKTVKVKVAVSVDEEGRWCAAGWSETEGESAIQYTIETLSAGEKSYILEAELELPEVKSIKAEVKTVDNLGEK